MSGYLQRLIRTAARPSESIRPWCGSVFDASRQPAEPRAHAESEASTPMASHAANSQRITAATHSDHPQPASSRAERVSDRVTFHDFHSEQPDHMQSRIAERREFKALLPQTDEEPSRIGVETLPRVSRRDASARDMMSSHADDHALSVTGPARGNVSTFPAGVVRAAQKTEAPPSRQSVTAMRQEQEIQIHIGRIEITAVQPPAPTPAKPRLKEVSLDAYLRRGEGKSR